MNGRRDSIIRMTGHPDFSGSVRMWGSTPSHWMAAVYHVRFYIHSRVTEAGDEIFNAVGRNNV